MSDIFNYMLVKNIENSALFHYICVEWAAKTWEPLLNLAARNTNFPLLGFRTVRYNVGIYKRSSTSGGTRTKNVLYYNVLI